MHYFSPMKHTTTYNVVQDEAYNPKTRDMRDVFQVIAVRFSVAGTIHSEVLAQYATRANADRVADALTATASDLA